MTVKEFRMYLKDFDDDLEVIFSCEKTDCNYALPFGDDNFKIHTNLDGKPIQLYIGIDGKPVI
jgi:hypothetical protein